MKVVLASRNRHKARELEELLGGAFSIVTLGDVGYFDEIIEDGETFEENAIIKAETVANALGLPVLADDSGLIVDALGGAPGVCSARYAGEPCDDKTNNAKLINELRALINGREPLKDEFAARYVCALALVTPGKKPITATGTLEGYIRLTPSGGGGFGYDPYFYVGDVSVASMSDDEKNQISHRAMAARELVGR